MRRWCCCCCYIQKGECQDQSSFPLGGARVRLGSDIYGRFAVVTLHKGNWNWNWIWNWRSRVSVQSDLGRTQMVRNRWNAMRAGDYTDARKIPVWCRDLAFSLALTPWLPHLLRSPCAVLQVWFGLSLSFSLSPGNCSAGYSLVGETGSGKKNFFFLSSWNCSFFWLLLLFYIFLISYGIHIFLLYFAIALLENSSQTLRPLNTNYNIIARWLLSLLTKCVL